MPKICFAKGRFTLILKKESAEIKSAKMSDEEARLAVYAPAGDMQKIKDATFMPAMDMLNNDGMDVQVFVYDKDAPPLKG